MHDQSPPAPLQLARSLGVPLQEVSLRLGVTRDWLRKLAQDPRHSRRIRVAELAACLETEKLRLTLESLIPPGRQ